MATTTIRNGIDVDQLMATIKAAAENDAVGTFTFRASSTWQDGTANVGTIQRFAHAGVEDGTRAEPFVLHGDEPPVLLGANRGPNAVELVLQALAFCYAVGFAANAAARGIDLSHLDYHVEGDLDVRRFLGMEGPRAGFSEVRITAEVASPNASTEQLTELYEHVRATSPVGDIITAPVPLTADLRVVEQTSI